MVETAATIGGIIFSAGVVIGTFRARLKSIDTTLKSIDNKMGRQDTTLDDHSCRISVLEAGCRERHKEA